MKNRFTLTLLIVSFYSIADSPEPAQLALALKQLDGVKTSLARAQTSASTDPQSRYFFDYLQAQQDITAAEQGIRHYLTPARAQPHAVQPLSASYTACCSTPDWCRCRSNMKSPHSATGYAGCQSVSIPCAILVGSIPGSTSSSISPGCCRFTDGKPAPGIRGFATSIAAPRRCASIR